MSQQKTTNHFEERLELLRLLREIASVQGSLRPDEHVSTSLEKARADRDKRQAEAAKHKEKLRGLAQRVQDLVDPIDNAREGVAALDEQLRPRVALIAERESDLSRLNAELEKLASEPGADLSQSDAIVMRRATLIEFLRINRTVRDQLKSDRAIKASALFDLQHRLGEIQAETQRVSGQVSKAEAQLQQANERVAYWEQALSALHSQLDTMTARIEELQALGISVPE